MRTPTLCGSWCLLRVAAILEGFVHCEMNVRSINRLIFLQEYELTFDRNLPQEPSPGRRGHRMRGGRCGREVLQVGHDLPRRALALSADGRDLGRTRRWRQCISHRSPQ